MRPIRPSTLRRAGALAAALACGLALVPVETRDRGKPAVRAGAAPGVRFVANRGAWAPAARFAVLGGPTAAWIGASDLTLRLERRDPTDPAAASGAVVRFGFGADDRERRVVAEGEAAATVHVLRGQEPADWAPECPAYERVRMLAAWPGIDVVFRADPEADRLGSVAYDLHVAPGADLGSAHIDVAGATIRAETADGGLVLAVPLGAGTIELAQRPPVSWIETADGPARVVSRLRRIDDRHFGFEVDDWDGEQPLVVDPGFVWSTYLGGGASDSCLAVRAVRGTGIVIAGWAGSSDFPTTVGAYQQTGASDAFVAMLSEDGSRLIWSTYVGGAGAEEALAIDVAADGSIVVGGWTGSRDFPTTAGVVQPWFGFGSFLFQIGDGFVLNLSADGSRLLWSTYLGRIGDDYVKAVHAAPDGSVIVAGDTTAEQFPTTRGALQEAFGSASILTPDLFVTKLAPGATALRWSTFFGGFAQELLESMVVAPDGGVVVAGLTGSQDFQTTPGAHQSTVRGLWDGFVATISADGASLQMSTLIGGEGYDQVRDVALDARGEIWVAGRTTSEEGAFPVTPDAYQLAYGTEEDGYVARLSADGTTLRAATLLGGDGDDSCEGIVVDQDGRVLVVGYTAGTGFPVGAAAAQPGYGGGVFDGFVAHFDPSLSFARAVSFAGGADKDRLTALDAFDGDEIVAAGTTFSADLPVSTGAAQPAFGGGSDAVVLRVELAADPAASVIVEDPHGPRPDADLVPGTRVVLAAAELFNADAEAVDLESVDVVIGGAGGGVDYVLDVSFHVDVDRDGQLGPSDQLLSGRIPVAGDSTVRLPVAYRLAARSRLPFLVVVATRSECPLGTELVGGLADFLAVTARRVVDGRRALVTGAAPIQGATRIRGERRMFSGDLDGDGQPTCRDARRLAARLGDAPGGPAEDPDRDGAVTERDVRMLLARIVHRAPVFVTEASAVIRAGDLLQLEGYDVPAGAVDATLDGQPLRVALRNARVLSFPVPIDVRAGTRRLRVAVGGTLLCDADVEVR